MFCVVEFSIPGRDGAFLTPAPADIDKFLEACSELSCDELLSYALSDSRSQKILSPGLGLGGIPGDRDYLVDMCLGLYALGFLGFPPRAGGGRNNSQRT